MKDKDRMMLDMRRHYEYKNFQDVLEQAKSLTASLSTEDLKYTEDEASSRNYDSDEDQVVQRNMAYSYFLNTYIQHYSKKNSAQNRMKSFFFWTIMGILVLITGVSIVLMIILITNGNMSYIDIAQLGTVVAGFITAFIVLPKVIANHLFPSREEDNTAKIFSQMFKYDQQIRESNNQTSDTTGIRPAGRSKKTGCL